MTHESRGEAPKKNADGQEVDHADEEGEAVNSLDADNEAEQATVESVDPENAPA